MRVDPMADSFTGGHGERGLGAADGERDGVEV